MDRKKSYFKELFKNLGVLLPALLFSSLIMTTILASYEFGLFGMLHANKRLFQYAVVALIIIALFTVIALSVEVKDNKATVSDSFFLSLIIVGFGFLVYVALEHQILSIHRLLFSLACIFFGGIFIVIRSHYFHPENPQSAKTCRRNTLHNYYERVIDGYSVFAILCTSAVTVAAGYLALNLNFARKLFSQTEDLVLAGIFIIPFFIYSIKSAFSKKISVIDALLLSAGISLPVLLVQVLVMSKTPIRVGLIGSLILSWLILTFIRYTTFDMKATLDVSSKPCECRCKIKSYFKTISSKYGIILALASAGLIALTALVLLGTHAIRLYFFTENGIEISLKSVPVAILTLSALAPLALGAFTSLIDVGRRSVGICDFLLLVSLFFCIFGFAIYLVHQSMKYFSLLIAFTGYNLLVLIIRIAVVRK